MSETLSHLRTQKDWSQADLAERSGVSASTISRLENGGEARMATWKKLEKALGGEIEGKKKFSAVQAAARRKRKTQ